ncbi:16818_t:CDS:1 [Cetraspora pellucida]|uniref:16818_t:CDS:1 n=1 Tax=Cetraspora pellucida TaxID=1433469 RepID=A0A9N9B6K4_9GLOM|nr:16818_t:CDS:1 [Cetraspora pellucida]
MFTFLIIFLILNSFLIFSISTENTEKIFDTTTRWTQSDTQCFNITTPIPNTLLDPNYRVYITWKMLEECYELVKESLKNTNNEQNKNKLKFLDNKFETSTPTLTTLTNKTFDKDELMKIMFKSFTIVLYNNPKQVGMVSIPRIKFDYSSVITNNTNSSPYLWVVPFIKSDSIKNIELYFIRVSSSSIVNEMEGEFSGVVGPFGINSEAARFPKTLFAPTPTKTENVDDGEPTHFGETENLHEPTPIEKANRNDLKSNNANIIKIHDSFLDHVVIAELIGIGMFIIFLVCG